MAAIAQGRANLLCIVPSSLTETRQSKKETTNIQRCSEPRVQPMSTAVDRTATIPRTRESSRDPEEQKTVTTKNVCSRQRLMLPSETRETAFNKDEGKHGQREILERRNIRQVPNKRRVEIQSENRDLLIRDVCTCLAFRGIAHATNVSIAICKCGFVQITGQKFGC